MSESNRAAMNFSPVLGPVLGPLSDKEFAEYQRLTALLDESERRRALIFAMKNSVRDMPQRLAALEKREQEVLLSSFAIADLRKHLHGRFKWPSIYRGC